MRGFIKITVLLLTSQCIALELLAQYNQENLKTALIYKIANCIVWKQDSDAYFTIGVLSNKSAMIAKFKELARVATINKKKIQVKVFTDVDRISSTNLLYVDESFDLSIHTIATRIAGQNTLLISDEHKQQGEIMINLKLDDQNMQSFEYNRANILFQGLDVTEEIVFLKGTEIEIKQLYTQAKKLWDEQQILINTLKSQTEDLNNYLNLAKDSLTLMKGKVEENKTAIAEQTKILLEKDSLSSVLNVKISKNQHEIAKTHSEILKLKNDIGAYESEVINNQKTISNQEILSDSLTHSILLKQKELQEEQLTLGEKETIISKQNKWLSISIIIIFIIIVSLFFIIRANISLTKAHQRIAEQKRELQETLEKLKNTQQQLIQSEKMASLGVLVAGIAHEINNPVNFINSGIEGIEKVLNKLLLLMDELYKFSPESTGEDIHRIILLRDNLKLQNSIILVPEVLSNIKMGIKRTIEITNGLRLYSRIEKEEKSLHDITQIIETALILVKPQIHNTIEIIKNYNSLPKIFVFPGKLSQVFVNLLTNAIDSLTEKNAIGEQLQINVTTKVKSNSIFVEICDNGKGIPQQLMDKIYDPFFTTKKVGKGTGLGLSITLGILEEHNGFITAKNNETSGATFTVQLPIN